LRVINRVVCANRADQIQVPRAAHVSDFGPERPSGTFFNNPCKSV